MRPTTDNPYADQDILFREFLLNYEWHRWSREQRVAVPEATEVLINERDTTAIKWWAEDEKQQFFFPITNPACPEWKYSSPTEWQVMFIGTIQELKNSSFSSRLSFSQECRTDKLVALLTVNHDLIGFDRKRMAGLLFPCEIVIRVDGKSKQLIFPKRYHYHSAWTAKSA